MELTPADLDSRSRMTLLKMRLGQMSSPQASSSHFTGSVVPAKRKPNVFRRWMMPESYLTPEEEAQLWPLIVPFAGGLLAGLCGGSMGLWVPGIAMLFTQKVNNKGAALMLLVGLTMTSVGLFAPRNLVKQQLTRALSADEIAEVRKIVSQGLQGTQSDSLENAYLTLIQEALQHQGLDTNTQTELKGAIKAIGAAIAGMPTSTNPLPEDPNALRSEAKSAREKARTETDSVIADSSLRRAEALERSAQTVEHSVQILRRTAALREELLAQTEALRLGLAASTQSVGTSTATVDVEGLTRLAESAQAVAREAGGIASARTELDTYVTSMANPTGLAHSSSYPTRILEDNTPQTVTAKQ